MRTVKREIVGAFIFSADDMIVMGKSLRGTYEGCWIIPGGGVDDGETYLQAIIREVKEETGLDISTEDIRQVDRVSYGQSKKILRDSGEEVMGDYTFYNFVVNLRRKSTEVELVSDDDFAEAAWHDVSKLKDMKLSPPSVENLKYIGYL